MKTSEASRTAQAVAMGHWLVAQRPSQKQLVPAEIVKALNEIISLWVKPWALWLLASFPGRAFGGLVEKLLVPGIALHYALRKNFIESQARKALGEGISRVIVLGAGLDTLCARLAGEFPRCEFLEIDHPATQALKRQWISTRGALPNLELLSLDLTTPDPVGHLLSGRSLKPTFILMESVLMYLPPADVRKTFSSLREVTTPDSRLVWSFMEEQSDGRIGFVRSTPLTDWWLRKRNEPFLWGLKLSKIQNFAQDHGQTMIDLFPAPKNTAYQIGDASLGEYFVVTEWR